MLGKSVGSLHNIPAPSSAVLNQALSLLATFGDSKAISKLLEEMRDVQAKNEQVSRDAQDYLALLKTRQDTLSADKEKFDARMILENGAVSRRAQELSQSEAQLSGRIAKFEQEQSTAKAELSAARESLAIAEQSISKREAVCTQKDAELNGLSEKLTQRAAELATRAKQLQDRENQLRQALGV